VDPDDWHRLLERLTGISDELAETVRLEVAVRGPGTAARTEFERMLPALEQLSRGTGDLAVLRSLLGLPPRRHPCSTEDIAGVVNGDLETVQRVLVGMIRQRAAEPDQ
jgi:hypothetical protein